MRENRQEGDWLSVDFSPRKAAISLYIYTGCSTQEELLKDMGKFKMGQSCIYLKKLPDINLDIFKKIIGSTIDFLQTKRNENGTG